MMRSLSWRIRPAIWKRAFPPKRPPGQGDGRDHRTGHRDHARVARRVCSDRLHGRHYRPVEPPVRPDNLSAAVLISSTLNALTLSPALCGIILRPPREQQFVLFRWFNKAFDFITGGYAGVIGRLVRIVAVVMLIYVGLVGFTGWSFGQLPTGFVPTERPGIHVRQRAASPTEPPANAPRPSSRTWTRSTSRRPESPTGSASQAIHC